MRIGRSGERSPSRERRGPGRGRCTSQRADRPSPGPRPTRGRGGKLSYKDQRDLDRLPGEIERIEAEIAAAEEALHDPDLYARDPKRFAELTERVSALRADKEAAEHRWLEVAEMAERLA